MYVGILPLSANIVAKNCILKGQIPQLSHVTGMKTEVKYDNFRFDLTCCSEGRPCIIEVKTVTMANSGGRPLKKTEVETDETLASSEKIAYFPEGSIKKADSKGIRTVSIRALHHVDKTKQLKDADPELRCILVFVVQRNEK